MPEINLSGAFSFLNTLKKIIAVSLALLAGFLAYLFKDDISAAINPSSKLFILEETVQITDDDILSSGYWKLNKNTNRWVCVHSISIHGLDSCKQTGSFYNSEFVKKFQLRLEKEDSIIVEIHPSNPKFETYWIGVYKLVFGHDESKWGDPLYAIYFQVGDTDDMRRVIYTKDKNDIREGRIFTTHYKDIIVKELEDNND